MAFALSDLQLRSSAFDYHGAIPSKHSGESDDVCPQPEWQGSPEGTKGFAVICHDPDVSLVQHGQYGFVHWVLYNLPASVTTLDKNTQQRTVGKNDTRQPGL